MVAKNPYISLELNLICGCNCGILKTVNFMIHLGKEVT